MTPIEKVELFAIYLRDAVRLIFEAAQMIVVIAAFAYVALVTKNGTIERSVDLLEYLGATYVSWMFAYQTGNLVGTVFPSRDNIPVRITIASLVGGGTGYVGYLVFASLPSIVNAVFVATN